jgi:phosphatidylinositol dimannoside acyltransferase
VTARLALWLRSWAYALGWALLRILPERVAAALFRAGADLATRRRGPSVRRLETNLARVLGPETSPERLAEVTRQGMRSYARYWLEVFRLPATPPNLLVDRFQVTDLHLLQESLSAPSGTVLALGHSGNWDHAGAWCGLTGKPFTTVAERIEPARLFDRFLAFRESLGMEVLPLTGSERPVFETLVERLNGGGMLCLLADRDLSRSGVEVDLFGARTRMPAGPALLALRTGATLLPTSIWYDGPLTRARIHPPVPHPESGTESERVRVMTQAVADALGSGPDGIAEHPEDWHMLQRLWLADLSADDPRRLPRADAA